MKKLMILALSLVLPMAAFAEGEDPQGTLTYSLPATTIKLRVEAVNSSFYAGPYAKYAKKFLGIQAKEKDEKTCQLTGITMTPSVEADQTRRYSIYAEKGQIDATCMVLSKGGFISFGAPVKLDDTYWRFPEGNDGDFSSKVISSSVTAESATLYRKDKNDVVSVQQNILVAKTPEQKAKEAADMILQLRQKKYQIVTGDTDATYSGEAMAAAIDEISRLEKEYLSLFIGYTECSTQEMSFEITPSPEAKNQLYIAFRISDQNGLLPADSVGGRPVVMEIVKSEISAPAAPEKMKKTKTPLVYYRIPSICNVKITEGTSLLLQARVPVYQLGRESSVPVNIVYGK